MNPFKVWDKVKFKESCIPNNDDLWWRELIVVAIHWTLITTDTKHPAYWLIHHIDDRQLTLCESNNMFYNNLMQE